MRLIIEYERFNKIRYILNETIYETPNWNDNEIILNKKNIGVMAFT